MFFQDRVTSLLDAHLSQVSNQLNGVMKVLTIISTIFMPLGVIVGLWGMNVTLPDVARWRRRAVLVDLRPDGAARRRRCSATSASGAGYDDLRTDRRRPEPLPRDRRHPERPGRATRSRRRSRDPLRARSRSGRHRRLLAPGGDLGLPSVAGAGADRVSALGRSSRTASSRRAHHSVRTRSASRWSGCSAAMVRGYGSRGSTCSTARRSSTSSHISRASLQMNFGAAGSTMRKRRSRGAMEKEMDRWKR